MLEIGIIIVVGMVITSLITENIPIMPKKLGSLLAVAIIVCLNIGNAIVFGDGAINEAAKAGIEQGLIAVGLYSTGKNTIQQIKKN